MNDHTLLAELKNVAYEYPETRKYLVPLFRKTSRKEKIEADWSPINFLRGYTKARKSISSVMGTTGGANLMALKSTMQGYAEIAAAAPKSGRGEPVKVWGMKGTLYHKHRSKMFVGRVVGLGDVILADGKFPLVSM